MQVPRDEMIAFIGQYRGCFSVECICRVMREHMVGGFLTPRGYRAVKTRKVCARRLRDALLIEVNAHLMCLILGFLPGIAT